MAVFTAPDFDAHEAVHFFSDHATGLKAIIAVHSTHLGPSAGGCRYWSYAVEQDAITDALRLSRGMSYKNAMAGLPMGGGKAVVLKSDSSPKTDAYLEALGVAIDSLGGAYVTAEDVGMTDADMSAIGRRTRHVSGLPVEDGAAGGNPGPSTARGVYLGMRAAIRHKLGRESFDGVHVAVQGLGSVGGMLARLLAADGAKLTIADIDEKRAAALAAELSARHVASSYILRTSADVLAPCALGAIFNEQSIAALDVAVIAGAANNQLATPEDGVRIHERGILYAPDYVINAGGIINVVTEYLGDGDADVVAARIAAIEPRLDAIFTESARSGQPTDQVADAMARQLIGRAA